MNNYTKLFRCVPNGHVFMAHEWDQYPIYGKDGEITEYIKECPQCPAKELDCTALGFVLNEVPE